MKTIVALHEGVNAFRTISDTEEQAFTSSNSRTLNITVTFSNKGETSYFLDKNLAFHNGIYTISCLSLNAEGKEIKRRINIKVKPSSFPDDYIEIRPHSSYRGSLVLNEYFNLPDSESISIQYQASARNPVTGNIDVINSTITEIEIGG
ncbi:hypothetical protein O5O45_23375 [Hahella aquimaris]|uniref:hypothetical protein n=1 Tax=Hahella sp. HNIBRBA332 TaxID=3015983 RepID=UPI00273A80F7|nr:hypothetical protein [Hahella sp. HNIBRBA332]WLQ12674.1 hypothetical protein O5O45_23375 [Hahella sp. HNIBRBA332]